MQIKDIVLYSKQGQRRILPFQIGNISIITGESSSGKSALIDIVDYCLGRSSCTIPYGPIRDSVEWFAIRLQFSTDQVFIARQNPPNTQQTSSSAIWMEATVVEIPEELPQQNTTPEAIKININSKLGISPNLNTPPLGQTRLPLAADFRHALFFCFQTQNDLTSKNELFHRQNERDGFVERSMKDTLPYFLGAVREDALRLENDLRQAKRGLKIAEQELAQAEAIRGQGTSNAVRLVTQAIAVGLLESIDPLPSELEQLATLLQQTLGWNPEDDILNVSSGNTTEVLSLLEERQRRAEELNRQISHKDNQIKAAEAYAQEADGYEAAAHQQELRLESIQLFRFLGRENTQTTNICPICAHELSEAIPSAQSIHDSLRNIQQSVSHVNRDRPQLRDYITARRDELESLKAELRMIRHEIEGIVQEQEEISSWRQLLMERSRVLGRISLWLENTTFSDENFELHSRIAEYSRRVEAIESQLAPEIKQDRLDSSLNRISLQMTKWAEQLQLEHADRDTPVRLNLSRATIVVDGSQRTIPLSMIGGGSNVQGYHLVAHLALHKYFVENNRPTPKFLFIDQPSQVFFSNLQNRPLTDREIAFIKETGSLEFLADSDRQSVISLFNFMFSAIESFPENGFQIIITDHVNLVENEKFQNSVIDNWRDGRKLVPLEWLSDTQSAE